MYEASGSWRQDVGNSLRVAGCEMQLAGGSGSWDAASRWYDP